MFTFSTSSKTLRLWSLTITLLVMLYMLFIGGAFDATVRFRVQVLNLLAAAALASIWLVVRLRQKATVRAIGLERILLLFGLSQWMAAIGSLQPRLSLEAVANVTAWACAFIILCDLLASGWPRDQILNGLLLVAAIVTLQALSEAVNWFAMWAGIAQTPPVAFRLTGFLGHPNLTAAVLNLLLPFVLAQVWLSSKWLHRFGLGLLGLGMLLAEFFSSSRAGWIAGGVTLGVFAVLVAWEERQRLNGVRAVWKRLPSLARFAVVGVSISLLIGVSLLFLRQAQYTRHSNNLIDSRGYYWLIGWRLFLQRPLTGIGPGLYTWAHSQFTSAPPNEVLPHAHSVFFQVLSGSGLLGVGAAFSLVIMSAVRLWQRWSHAAPSERIWTAAVCASLTGALIHHMFDYFLTSQAFVFLLVIICALAFAPTPNPATVSPTGFRPVWLMAPLAITMSITLYALRGTLQHERGLTLANENRWAEAGQAFHLAAEADPGFGLYWAEAALAFSHTDDSGATAALWQRAIQADPYWALWLASLATATRNPETMRQALTLAPKSDLFALNWGVGLETSGEEAAARTAYHQALDLNPASARALFWAQTPLRAGILAEWQAAQPVDDSLLAQGWATLETGNAQQAVVLFEQARVADPLSNIPYLGLARVAWAMDDEGLAERYLRVGENLPVYFVWQKIDPYLLRGEWATAHGDRTSAMEALTTVFNAINDYTSAGPGTYGYPWRNWVVYHRATLPTDLVPQFVHADITSAMDVHFAQLAQWYAEAGDLEAACLIVSRVAAEAPVSESGKLRAAFCP